MASIEKRGKNSWRLVVEAGYGPDHKRIKRSKTIKVEDEALLKTTKKLREHLNDELVKFKTEVEAGVYIAPDKMTFSAFVEEEWKEKYAKKSLGKLTYKTYVSHLDNHILPAFGHMRLDQIQTMHLVTFINNLQKDGARKDGKDGVLASGTVEYIYRVAKNVFSRAVDWKLLKENPIDGVLKPKVEHQEMKYYEEDQAHPVIRKLYELAPVVWRMFSLGAMLGGFRRGELLGLEWPDVDFIENTLTVKRSISMTENGQAVRKDPKNTSSRRIVAMPEWYMAELKEYHKQWMVNYWKISELNKWLGGDHQVVFHAGFGKPFYHTQPSKWWAKFLKKHGFEHIRFHDLRHTSATILIENDAAMKAIQKRLGHSKYQTTADLYTHVTKKVSKATASKLDHLNPSPIRPQDQKESDTETFIPTMTNAQK